MSRKARLVRALERRYDSGQEYHQERAGHILRRLGQSEIQLGAKKNKTLKDFGIDHCIRLVKTYMKVGPIGNILRKTDFSQLVFTGRSTPSLIRHFLVSCSAFSFSGPLQRKLYRSRSKHGM